MSMRCPSNQALSPVSRILRMKHWGYLKYNPTWRAVSITSSPSIYHHISSYLHLHLLPFFQHRRRSQVTNLHQCFTVAASIRIAEQLSTGILCHEAADHARVGLRHDFLHETGIHPSGGTILATGTGESSKVAWARHGWHVMARK